MGVTQTIVGVNRYRSDDGPPLEMLEIPIETERTKVAELAAAVVRVLARDVVATLPAAVHAAGEPAAVDLRQRLDVRRHHHIGRTQALATA